MAGASPFAIAPLGGFSIDDDAERQRQPAAFPAYSPAQHRALIEKLLESGWNRGIGALEAVGNTLDVPRSAIASGLSSVMSGLGMQSHVKPGEKVYGRDLLEQAGLLGGNKPGLDWGDVAGFGVDMATDPLTYLGIGTLTKAGRAAEAASSLTRGLGAGIRSGERSLVALHVPFTGIEKGLGAGNAAIGNALESAGKYVGSTRPALLAKGLFTGRAGGAFTERGQELAGLRHDILPEALTAARGAAKDAEQSVNDAFGALDESFGFKANSPNFQHQAPLGSVAGEGADEFSRRQLFDRAVRLAAETREGRAAQAIAEPLGAPLEMHARDVFANAEKVRPTAQKLVAAKDEMFDALRDQGISTPYIENHFLRQAPEHIEQAESKFRTRRAAPTWFASGEHRIEATRDLPAEVANAMLLDPKARAVDPKLLDFLTKHGMSQEQIAEALKSAPAPGPGVVMTPAGVPVGNPEHWLSSQSLKAAGSQKRGRSVWLAGKIPKAAPVGSLDPAAHIAEAYRPWLRTADEAAVEAAVKEGATPEMVEALHDAARYEHAKGLAQFVAERPAKRRLGTRSVVQDFRDNVVQMANVSATMSAVHKFFGDNIIEPGTVAAATHAAPVGRGFMDVGYTLEQAFASLPNVDRARAVAHFAAKHGLDAKDVADWRVPVDVVDAAAGLLAPATKPEWAAQIGRAIDQFSNMWKRWVTLPFLGFHVRNASAGQAVNMTSGYIRNPSELGEYMRNVASAFREWINPSPVLARDLEVSGVLGQRAAFDVPLGNHLAGMPEKPWNVRTTWRQAGEAMGQSRLDAIPGARLGRQAARTVTGTGSKAAQFVEWMNRVPMYTYLREKGFENAAAAKKVMELQFDYGRQSLAPFENEAMRRLIPFYVYQRRVVPLILKTVAERPGGPIPQAIRATQEARQEGGFLPSWVGEGAAVPMGDGRYLTGFGLPWEQAFNTGVLGPNLKSTVSRTLEKAVAQSNPLISGVYTLASGREPFRGREIGDLYPYPTRSPVLNAAIQHTPISRALTTARQLADERKGLGAKMANALTGLRIEDLSGGVERAKQIEARRLLNDLSQEQPHLLHAQRDFYANPMEKALVSPKERELLRLKAGLDRAGKEYAKKKRAATLFGASS